MIEDFYPVAPMQQGLLLPSLYEQQSGIYIEQIICSLHEDLNVLALRQSWQRVLERHSILRTSFHHRHSNQLMQTVSAQVQLPWKEHDLRDLSPSEQQDQLNAYLQSDRESGFDIREAPLMRLALLQLAEGDYKLIWTFHHALLDGRSFSIVLNEVFTIYQAICQNQDYDLAEPRPYQDFINWLQQYSPSKAEEFWRQLLHGVTAPTPLPGFNPDVSTGMDAKVRVKSSGERSLSLSEETTSALQALAKDHQLTLNTIIQGAWALLLGRHSGQEDVVFGAIRAGRGSALKEIEQIKSMVGLFISTVPVRVKVDPNLSLLPWLKELRTQWMAMRDYEHTPLVEIQKWSEVPRGTPLFESLVMFENGEMNAELRSQGGNWEHREFELLEQIDYPLVLCAHAGTQLLLKIHYDSRRLGESEIARILEQLETMLQGIAAQPDRCLWEVPVLTPTEQHQLLVEWNNTHTAYPKNVCIHQLFEALVQQSSSGVASLAPDAVAVVYENEQLTYQELNARANQVAHHLQRLGVKPDTMVGLFVERSLETIVGLLGILKAGGAYVPVNPAYPAKRIAFMLEETQVSVLLTQQSLATKLPELQARVVCLDTDWEAIAQESEANPHTEVNSQNLAYVIYTSGSTGKPKGVAIEHRSVINLSTGLEQAIFSDRQNGQLRVSLNGPLAFDTSVKQIIQLLHGHTLYVVPEALRFDEDALLSYLRRNQIDVFDCTPSQLRLLISAGLLDESEFAPQYVLVGGEAIDQSTWQTLANAKHIRFFNVYGPTECTVDATVCELRKADLRPVIGRPIANTQLYLLDRYLQPVPLGVAGELYIAGEGLARGYLNRPVLTAERFIPNPFNPGTRLYRTGDLVRYLPDGNLEYLGRADDQVKIRGFRIELAEIEAVLLQHSAVEEAVVIAREDVPGDKRLVAYLTQNQEQVLTAGELRRFLKANLPDYMVPSAFVVLEALPLTPNGKIDRRGLPAPDQRRLELESTFVAPRTRAEQVLAKIWGEVLGVQRVSIYDNFFEMGGHSLLATKVISRLRAALKVELPLYTLFEFSTVADLAEQVEMMLHEDDRVSDWHQAPIAPAPRDGELPLSFAQARLWFLNQLEGPSATYNIPAALHMTGSLNKTYLEQAVTEILRRHEVLRATFSVVNSMPVQAIAPSTNVTIPVVDLQALPEEEKFSEAQRLASEEAQRPFDISKDCLVRTTLLRLGDEEHVLLVTIHHIVTDGWSTGVLIQELSTLYEAFSQGQPSPLPELPIQYADFAHWQRQYLQGEALETQLDYWKRQLTGAPALLELPTDRPRPSVQSFRGGTEYFQLNSELTQKLKALSQTSGVTLYMTLLAAFATLLSRYSGQEDVVVGSPIANRTRSELESLIGFFVNTLVLRADLQGNPTFSELLNRVRQVALNAYAHQDVPFEQLVEVLQPERNANYHPLFQVMFVLQNVPRKKLELSGLTITPWKVDSKTAKFDLNLLMEETPDGLKATWEYKSDLFDASTIARMAGHFQTLLEAIAVNPEQPILKLPLLSDAEQHQLLVEWNDTRGYPKAACMHELFEVQAEQTPDALAVLCDGRQLTYQDLNTKANKVAHYLRGLGVGPEVLVGICVERSLDMVVGLLGILKAGGAYVPLDPKYPKERLADLLSDSQAPVLLTQQSLVARLPEHDASVVCLDTDWIAIEGESAENPDSGVQPEHLAYIIYTSGSTGKPKGVTIEHRGAVNTIIDINERFQVTSADRVLNVCSLNFDLSVYDVFGLLAAGATIVIPEASIAPNPARWLELMQRDRVTLWNSAPPVMQLFMGYLSGQSNVSLPDLSLVMLSGDWIPVTLPDQIKAVAEKAQVISLGGATEASIWSIYYPIEAVDPTWKSIPYGRPLANQQFYVLNSQLQPAPIGVAGELHIGGVGVARSYFNRPELTEQKFIPDPFSDEPGARLYKTGDLGRYLPDGNIEFLGRLDHQVKIRGFRIELGEIESVLSQHPKVRETLVIAREDRPGNKYLAAYVIPQKGEVPSPSELRDFLKQTLPDYMVPAFVVLEALPLTPNGKIDRRALPIPEQGTPETQKTFVAPRDRLESQLVEIWESILSVKPIGVKDNFFELGGHSLLAASLWNQIEQVLGKKLPLATLFQAPTIEQLANALREEGWSPSCSSLMVIKQGSPKKTPLFCIHVLGRGLEFYRPMARHFDSDQPLYGLTTEISTLDQKEAPANRVEELAAFYVKEMRTLQPQGPYLLAGVSFGGEVAFEMAQMLVAQGEKVAMLALLDTIKGNVIKRVATKERFSTHWNNLFKRGPVYIWDKLQPKLEEQFNNFDMSRKRICCKFYQRSGRPLSQELQEFTYRELNREASAQYIPKVYPGRITMIRATEKATDVSVSAYIDPELGWGGLAAKGIEIHEVEGNHLSMLKEPYVQKLAETLAACMDKALATAK